MRTERGKGPYLLTGVDPQLSAHSLLQWTTVPIGNTNGDWSVGSTR